MKSKIFERVAQKVGKTVGSLVNKTIHLKESVRFGYGQSRIKKCIWCKNEFPIIKLRLIMAGKYPMCNYCLEGLAAPEAMMPEKYKQHASQIIDEMLARVAADKDSHSAAINSFIMEVTNDHRLGFDFELKKDVAAPSGAELEKIKLRFKEILAHYSSSFRDIVKEELKSGDLAINFHPFGAGPFESSPLASARLIKYRYIRR